MRGLQLNAPNRLDGRWVGITHPLLYMAAAPMPIRIALPPGMLVCMGSPSSLHGYFFQVGWDFGQLHFVTSSEALSDGQHSDALEPIWSVEPNFNAELRAKKP